jgi:tetratricopeptide (TPR) repeat protein
LRILEQLGTRGDAGDALRGLSRVRRELGAPHEAREFVAQALAIAREHDNIAWEAQWLIDLGHALVALDELPEALTACQRAAVLHRRLGDRSREATALDGAGIVYRLMSRPEEAVDFHRLAAATFRETGEQWRLALALTNLGAALRGPEAEASFREALDLLAAFTDPRSTRLQQEIRDRLSQPGR